MSNPATHTCHDCGHVWIHGQHGGHDCLGNVRRQRDEAKADLDHVLGFLSAILLDLPTLKDWLDPTLEKAANNAVKELRAKYKEVSSHE